MITLDSESNVTSLYCSLVGGAGGSAKVMVEPDTSNELGGAVEVVPVAGACAIPLIAISRESAGGVIFRVSPAFSGSPVFSVKDLFSPSNEDYEHQ